MSLQGVNPGASMPFGHHHAQDEEVYVVLSGSGSALVEGESVELAPMSALRVAPAAARSFQAGEEGLELLAFGAHTEDDAKILPSPWDGEAGG